MDLSQLRKIAGITEETVTSKPKYLSEGMNEVRKAAGLPLLVESYDEDDEDEDVKKADAEAKKRNIKLPKVKDADEDDEPKSSKKADPYWGNLVKKAEDKKEDKASEKKADKAPEKKAEDKKEEEDSSDDERLRHLGLKKPKPKPADPNAPKKRGKAPNAASKSGVLRQWIIDHPGVTRAQAWAHAVEKFGEKSEENTGGITKAGFSTLYQNARSHHGLVKKREVKESWVIMHPSINNHILHENREMNQFQWVSFLSENQDPMIFDTLAEAEEVARYLMDFRNQQTVIEHVQLED